MSDRPNKETAMITETSMIHYWVRCDSCRRAFVVRQDECRTERPFPSCLVIHALEKQTIDCSHCGHGFVSAPSMGMDLIALPVDHDVYDLKGLYREGQAYFIPRSGLFLLSAFDPAALVALQVYAEATNDAKSKERIAWVLECVKARQGAGAEK